MAIGVRTNLGTANATVAGTTLVITTTAASAAVDDTIFVAFSIRDVGGTANPSVTDSAGNVYVPDEGGTGPTGSGVSEAWLFRSANANGLGSGGTITISGLDNNANSRRAATAFKVASDNPLTLSQHNINNGASTTPTSGNVTLPTAPQLMIGVVGISASTATVTFTQDADYSSSVTTSQTAGGTDTNNRQVRVGDRDAGSTETNNYAPGLSGSATWVCLLCTYEESTPGGGGTNRRRRVLC